MAAAELQAAAARMDAAAARSTVKLGLPSFVGEGTNDQIAEELECFIEDFESYCDTMSLTGPNRLAALRQCFKKNSEGARWYAATSRDSTKAMAEWVDAKALMQQRFDVPRTAGQLAGLRDTLKQKAAETVRPFADRCTLYQQQVDKERKKKVIPGVSAAHRNLCVDVFGDQDCTMAFISGVKPAIRAILTQTKIPNTFQGVIDAAVLAEIAVREAATPAAVAPVGQELLGATGPATGSNKQSGNQAGGSSKKEAGKKNYPPSNRPKWLRVNLLPKGMCYTCGFAGHVTSECKVPLANQRWQSVIKELGLQPPPAQQRQQGRQGVQYLQDAGQQQQQGGQQVHYVPVVPQPGAAAQPPPAATPGLPPQWIPQGAPNFQGPAAPIQGFDFGGGAAGGGQGSYADF